MAPWCGSGSTGKPPRSCSWSCSAFARTVRKCCWPSRQEGGETSEAWRAVLDDLIKRGLRKPEFLIVDGGTGLEQALAALWGDVPTQRYTVHKHRNLLAHAPQRLHEEVSADYNDMIYATSAAEIEARRC